MKPIIYFWKHTRSVTVDGKTILPAKSQKLRNHSPDGFNWGFAGSGPSQLALALLLEFSGKRKFWCLQNYQQFKVDVIAMLPQDSDCELLISTITKWVADHTPAEGPGLKPI